MVIFFTFTTLNIDVSALAYSHSGHVHTEDCYDATGALICLDSEEGIHIEGEDDILLDMEHLDDLDGDLLDEDLVLDDVHIGHELVHTDVEAGTPAANVDIPAETAPDDRALVFSFGKRQSVALSEIMDSLGLNPGHVTDVSVALEDGEEAALAVEWTGSDFVIVALRAFDEAALTVVANGGAFTVKLVDGRPGEVAGDEPVETAQPEAEDAPIVSGDSAADGDDAAVVDGDGSEPTDEVTDGEEAPEGGEIPVEAGEPAGEDAPEAEGGEIPVEAGEPAGEEAPEAEGGEIPVEAGEPAGEDAPEAEGGEIPVEAGEPAGEEAPEAEGGEIPVGAGEPTESEAQSEAEGAPAEAEETAEPEETPMEAEETAEPEETPMEAEETAEPEEAPAEGSDDAGSGEAEAEAAEPAEPEEAMEESGEAEEAPGEGVAYSYTFEKQKSVFLNSLLSKAGVVAEGRVRAVASSDPEAVQVRGPYAIFGYVISAKASFDAVMLDVTCDGGSYEILLSNPEAGERMAPGDEMVTDDGRVRVVFAEEVVLPEGTTLTVTEGEPDLDRNTWAEIDRGLEQAQEAGEADLRWFDISLGDVHEVRATVTLADVAKPGDDVLIVHVTHENEVVIIEDTSIGADGSVTFDTDGFSPMGVVNLLGAGNDDEEPLWSVDDKGVLTIYDQEALNYTGNAPWVDGETTITAVVIKNGVTAIPEDFAKTGGLDQVNSVTLANSVEKVGANAFAGCASLEKINLNQVAEIGAGAFKDCAALDKVSLDNAVEIGANAFNGAAITAVKLPGSLETIGEGAFANCENLMEAAFDRTNMMDALPKGLFEGCESLTKATLPEDLKDIPENLFSGCTALETVNLSKLVLLDTIGKNAFKDCPLEKVDLPEGPAEIRDGAFSGCASLQEVKFPESLERIGAEAFKGCESLTAVELSGELNSVGKNAFSGCASLESVDMENTKLTQLPENMLSDCASLTEIKLPKELTSLGNYAFSGCAALETVVLPDKLETIGNSAFSGCTALEKVDFPDGLNSLGSEAFKGCTKLTGVTLPASLETAGSSVFQDCTGIVSVDMERAALKELPANMFKGCTKLTEAKLPQGLETIGNSAFNACAALKTAVLPDGLKTIGNSAFSGCKALSRLGNGTDEGVVRLPATLEKVGTSAFYDCDGFLDAEIPDSVYELGASALGDCNNMTRAVIGEGVKTINTSLFYNDTKLEYVEFKGKPKEIPNNTFQYCYSLKEFPLWEGLERIGSSAFSGCSSLTGMTFPDDGNLKTIGSSAFSGCSKLTSANVPDSVTSLGSYAFNNCSGITEAHIPSGLKTLNSYVFNGCSSLREIELPSALETISDRAFCGCSKLADVTLPGTLKTIGSYAFYGCNAKSKVVLTRGMYLAIVAAGQLAQYGLEGKDLSWRVDGLIYDKTEHGITVEVEYDEENEDLKTTVSGKDADGRVAFNNSFTTDSTSASLIVNKRIDGRTWLRSSDESYTFHITPDPADAPMPMEDGVRVSEVVVQRGRDINAPVQSTGFDIAYEWSNLRQADGTHAKRKAFDYVLTEVVPEDAQPIVGEDGQVVSYMYRQVRYDLTSRTIRVWLIDNGDGTIGTEVEYLAPGADPDAEASWIDQPEPFVNTYKKETELTEFPLSITKQVNGDPASIGRYTFTLYDADGKVVLDNLAWDGEAAEDGRMNLSVALPEARKIDCTDIDLEHPKTVEYTLRENIPGDAMGFNADGTPLNVKYAEAMDGQKASTEILWKNGDMTYDSSIIQVHVTVALDILTYLMKPTVKYGEGGLENTATVNNYIPVPVDVALPVEKQLLSKQGTPLETWA